VFKKKARRTKKTRKKQQAFPDFRGNSGAFKGGSPQKGKGTNLQRRIPQYKLFGRITTSGFFEVYKTHRDELQK